MSWRILVGGDSYAEFPYWEYVQHYHEWRVRKDWQDGHRHWIERWAEMNNSSVASCGMPGFDTISSSMELLNRIWRAKRAPTHVIYYTTTFHRTIQTPPRELKGEPSPRQYLKRMVQLERDSKLSFEEYMRKPFEMGHSPGTAYNTLDEETMPDIDWNHVWNRMDRVTQKEFYFKQISCLSMLDGACRARGAQLIVTSGFGVHYLWHDWARSTGIPVINCTQNVPMNNPKLPSHFSAQEHRQQLRNLLRSGELERAFGPA
jgi:hypothetical protein